VKDIYVAADDGRNLIPTVTRVTTTLFPPTRTRPAPQHLPLPHTPSTRLRGHLPVATYLRTFADAHRATFCLLDVCTRLYFWLPPRYTALPCNTPTYKRDQAIQLMLDGGAAGVAAALPFGAGDSYRSDFLPFTSAAHAFLSTTLPAGAFPLRCGRPQHRLPRLPALAARCSNPLPACAAAFV